MQILIFPFNGMCFVLKFKQIHAESSPRVLGKDEGNKGSFFIGQ